MKIPSAAANHMASGKRGCGYTQGDEPKRQKAVDEDDDDLPPLRFLFDEVNVPA